MNLEFTELLLLLRCEKDGISIMILFLTVTKALFPCRKAL